MSRKPRRLCNHSVHYDVKPDDLAASGIRETLEELHEYVRQVHNAEMRKLRSRTAIKERWKATKRFFSPRSGNQKARNAALPVCEVRFNVMGELPESLPKGDDFSKMVRDRYLGMAAEAEGRAERWSSLETKVFDLLLILIIPEIAAVGFLYFPQDFPAQYSATLLAFGIALPFAGRLFAHLEDKCKKKEHILRALAGIKHYVKASEAL